MSICSWKFSRYIPCITFTHRNFRNSIFLQSCLQFIHRTKSQIFRNTSLKCFMVVHSLIIFRYRLYSKIYYFYKSCRGNTFFLLFHLINFITILKNFFRIYFDLSLNLFYICLVFLYRFFLICYSSIHIN